MAGTVAEIDSTTFVDAQGKWTIRRARIEADAAGAAAKTQLSPARTLRRTLLLENESAAQAVHVAFGTVMTNATFRSRTLPTAGTLTLQNESAPIQVLWAAADAGKYLYLTEIYAGGD
jgi:hypothetical protein